MAPEDSISTVSRVSRTPTERGVNIDFPSNMSHIRESVYCEALEQKDPASFPSHIKCLLCNSSGAEHGVAGELRLPFWKECPFFPNQKPTAVVRKCCNGKHGPLPVNQRCPKSGKREDGSK